MLVVSILCVFLVVVVTGENVLCLCSSLSEKIQKVMCCFVTMCPIQIPFINFFSPGVTLGTEAQFLMSIIRNMELMTSLG
jgi:hypothetical protein